MYHFGNAINMAEMMSHVPENLIAMGNVDPAGEFRNGTAESVYNRTKEVMNECCKYKNFVISSGCDIPPMSPWENINAFPENILFAPDWYEEELKIPEDYFEPGYQFTLFDFTA